MNLAQRSAAARNAGAALMIAAILVAAGVARAEGEIQLLLPLVRAMAFGMVAAQATKASSPSLASQFGATPPPRNTGSVIPSRVRIPDQYSTEYELEPPHFAKKVERDRLVSLDLISKPRHGWTAFVAYDEESQRPFPGTGQVLRFVAEYDF
jgi:hypothetical protein